MWLPKVWKFKGIGSSFKLPLTFLITSIFEDNWECAFYINFALLKLFESIGETVKQHSRNLIRVQWAILPNITLALHKK